jgi:hypothetical protein
MVIAYLPALKVTLIKMVQRTAGVAARYTAADRTIDLTPYLGDAGVVRTQKSLTDPCGGFSVTFADKMEPKAQDSLYALIEPMDMIEIRAARRPELYVGGNLPLIMRGYVSVIRRAEAIGSDGTPQRIVVVQGQDSGKLLQIHAIWWEVAVAQEQAALTAFRMQNVFNMPVTIYSLSDFVSSVITKILNPKVAALAGVAQHAIAPFTVAATVPEGQLIPKMVFGYSGNIWNLIAQYAEQPWDELFVEDTEGGPVVVFRPTPFHGLDGQLLKGADGKLLMAGAAEPGTIPVDAEEIVSLDLVRTDANIANFFLVPAGASMLATGMAVDTAALISGQPLDFNYGNNNPALYGQKKMVHETRAIPTTVGQLPTMLPANQQAAGNQQFVAWHARRAQQLKYMNRDNGVFEDGSLTLRGYEYFKPGRYLRITRGQIVFEVYIQSVGHTIMPFGNWTTQIGAIRGTGFNERIKAAPSPYIAEGRPGVYPALP